MEQRKTCHISCNLEEKALETNDDLGTNTWWREAWYLEKSNKVNHEGMWLRIFQLDRGESAYLEKKDKG